MEDGDVHLSDPVVLLHAFPLDARMWDGLRAAHGDRLITPNLPGFGGAPLVGPPDLNLAAAAVVALLDKLEVERAIVGGCSMGGYVSMALVRQAPERVSGLVLMNTRASADAEEARAKRYAVAARAEAEGIGWLADEMMPTLLGPTTLAKRPEAEATVRGLIADQVPGAVVWAVRAMAARPPSYDELAASDLPALVIRGAEDALIPAEETTALVEALPGSAVVELPGVGHLAPLEAPDEVAQALTDWLDD